MKLTRNFSAPILDLDDQPVRAGATAEALLRAIDAVWPSLSEGQQQAFNAALDKEVGKPLTLATASVSALLGVYDNDRELADEERIARLELARKVHKGGVLEITPEERDRLKPLFKKRFGGVLVPVVAGELLEQEPKS